MVIIVNQDSRFYTDNIGISTEHAQGFLLVVTQKSTHDTWSLMI